MIKLTKKQTVALDRLENKSTREVLYGGAAGPGKSFLGCYWQLKQRYKYPGTKGLIGRAHLKTLKDTTLQTMFTVQKLMGLERGVHWDLTGGNDKENPNAIVYTNGSKILLRDLFFYPSDPDFDELGSLEITDAFIDECGQVKDKARQTVITRIRYQLDENGLIPKILYATNPTKGWAYRDFYQPYKQGTLRGDRAYVPAYVTDNPNVPLSYIDSLDAMPEGAQKQRLRYGNWEYDDDPSTLIEYDAIIKSFESVNKDESKQRYISCDYARYGSDTTVICVWHGMTCKVKQYKGLSVPGCRDEIKRLQAAYSVPTKNVTVDEDGVGGGVVDLLPGCRGFVNNSRAVDDENFDNLKSQCYFKLADAINIGMVKIDCDAGHKDLIIQELENVKQKSVDKDQKKGVIPKDMVKQLIGRSPHFSDAISMRFVFEIGVKRGVLRVRGF